MPEPRTLGDLALEVRSKNAGPFWMTLEAFMPDDQTYRIADALITAELISELYQVPSASVQLFRIPDLRVVKASFPRPITQGSLMRLLVREGQSAAAAHDWASTASPIGTIRPLSSARSTNWPLASRPSKGSN